MPDIASQKAALEFKSATLTVPALLLASNDLTEIEQRLLEKMAQAPDLFRQSPVVIDLHRVNGQELALEIEPLVALLRKLNMVPISLRGGTDTQNRCAETIGLALGSTAPSKPAVADPVSNGPTEKAASTAGRPAAPQADIPNLNKTITLPVRSGQRVYARGDLIIMATVSAGAEVMAEGNIHVYGSLRGKALAGVLGDVSARIFCMDLQAELISIAGIYQLSDDIAETSRNKPATISLDNQMLMIKEI